MRLIRLDSCQSGMKLGKTIYNEKGKALLIKGTELTDHLIKRLKKMNTFTIYIEDHASEGIEIIESIPERLHAEAASVITEGLDAISELSQSTANIHGMMKTGRVIRSFQKVFRDILQSLMEHPSTLNLLAQTKIHENHVYTHSLGVTIYACQLAIANGLPLKNIEEIGLGAMLHDVGKMHIPLAVLNKPGKLTDEEYKLIQSHSEIGFETLRKIHEIPLAVAHCAFQHHERLDGAGYPRGLKEDDIHAYAKIISVADVFDAVTSQRVYRTAMLPHQGLELLYAGSGTQFENKQVQMFKDCIAIYPQGVTVKLKDGRTGIVSKYNGKAAGRPEIRIIRNEENQEVVPYEIDLSAHSHLTIEIVEADALV